MALSVQSQGGILHAWWGANLSSHLSSVSFPLASLFFQQGICKFIVDTCITSYNWRNHLEPTVKKLKWKYCPSGCFWEDSIFCTRFSKASVFVPSVVCVFRGHPWHHFYSKFFFFLWRRAHDSSVRGVCLLLVRGKCEWCQSRDRTFVSLRVSLIREKTCSVGQDNVCLNVIS